MRNRNSYEDRTYIGGFRDVSNEQREDENMPFVGGRSPSYDRFGPRAGQEQLSRGDGGSTGMLNDYDYRDRGSRGMERGPVFSRSVNLERFGHEANRFINEVADELGTSDGQQALRITRAVLHAVRDRIPADDAVQFSQGLITVIRGIYFEQYDLSRTPVVIRSQDEFISFVRNKNREAAMSDFPTREHVIQGIKAVFRVLERNMDYGQVEQIKRLVSDEVRELIEGRGYGRQ